MCFMAQFTLCTCTTDYIVMTPVVALELYSSAEKQLNLPIDTANNACMRVL